MSDGAAYRTTLSRVPPEDGYYVVAYPEIPGCLGVDETEAEAIEDGRRALIAVLGALKAVDRPAPEARGPSA